MALVVSAYDLVVKVEALPSGVEAFALAVPNTTFCTDGMSARASFMVANDREHFAAELRLPSGALARVEKRNLTADVDWLVCGRYAGADATWLKAAPPGPLVVPVSWTPGELTFGTREEMAKRLEYLGREGSVEVYRDRVTGEKVYTGRTQPTVPPPLDPGVAALRDRALELLKPLLWKRGHGFFEKRRLRKGMALLSEVLAAAPRDAVSLWFMGMSLRAVAAHADALSHFRRAWEANPNSPDVGREYAGQCFMVGEGAEGLRISRELHARFPDDVGLHSNLALAHLIGGDLGDALALAKAALAREPDNAITRTLVDYITRVKSGRLPRPDRMPGM